MNEISAPVIRKHRIGTPLEKNSWHTLNGSDTVFVYVHGFFSNSDRCWTSKTGVKWPDLLVDDERLGAPSIFTAGYYTAFDSGEFKISDCARELIDALQRPGLQGEPTVLSKKSIVFVCHSLGGIVTRYMIERNSQLFLSKSIALILIASPSYGAELANTFAGVIKLFNNKMARQLISGNDSLDDLDDRFKDFVMKRTIPLMYGAEAIEQNSPFHWKYIPALKPIVSKSSAARYFGASKLLPGTNHSTCVKPTSHLHVSHEFLVSSYFEFKKIIKCTILNLPRSTHLSNSGKSKKLEGSEALFEVYIPENEKYYVCRHVDTEIKNLLDVYCLWVFGESGIGKTAAVRRWALMQELFTIQVYIGESGNTGNGHAALLSEIYYTIAGKADFGYKEFSTTNQIINEIVRLMIILSEDRSVCLVIDEIPIINENPAEMQKFLQAIHSIAVQLKQELGLKSARIVATSIYDPNQYLGNGSGRISEHIKFFKLHKWEVGDLEGLVTIITSNIPSLRTSQIENIAIANSEIRTPRFVKTVFKNICARDKILDSTVNEVMRETKIQLGYTVN